MAVDASLASLYERLKVEDPCLPPRPWESIPSQSGVSHSSSRSDVSTRQRVLDVSSVSEASLVRLVMNALQGVKSAVLSIEKISMAFSTNPADRSFHQISSLWSLSSSTHSLGNILLSIGYSGCLVFLLTKFVDYFASFNLNKASTTCRHETSDELNMCSAQRNVHDDKQLPCTLVNQAFAVAVGKVLNGYKSALDTLCPSICLRRSAGGTRLPLDISHSVGCLTNVVLSDISLLEVYLHTKELRTQIEALGSICKLQYENPCLSQSSLECIIANGTAEFCNFPRGGDLLSYLYQQLQVADPTHCRLLKYLFVQSCGPYLGFIRSWIYKAEINDPHKEFIIDHANNSGFNPRHSAGDDPVVSIQLRDAVAVPCFLKELSVPVIRAGQQLQVLRNLLELCKSASGSPSPEEILPCYGGFWSNFTSCASHFTFSKEHMEALVNARNIYYCRMQEKVEKFFMNLDIRYELVEQSRNILPTSKSDQENSDYPASFALRRSSFLFRNAEQESSILVNDNVFPDGYSLVDELSCGVDECDSLDCSSLESTHEQSECEDLVEPANSVPSIEHTYLSALQSLSGISINSSFHKRQVPGNEKQNFHGSFPGATKSYHTDHGSLPIFKLTHDGFQELPDSFVNNKVADDPSKRGFSSLIYHERSNHFNGGFLERPTLSPCDSGVQIYRSKVKDAEDIVPCLKGMVPIRHISAEKIIPQAEDEYSSHTQASLSLFTLKPLELGEEHIHLSYKLNANPMLTRRTLTTSSNATADGSVHLGRSLHCFDFSSVEHPFKLRVEKLDADTNNFDPPLQINPEASAANVRGSHCGEKGHCVDSNFIANHDCSCQHSALVTNDREGLNLTSVSGGSSWESLLSSCRNKVTKVISEWTEHSSACFAIPLDFVVEKCIVQEIFLQYKYVSRVTIKLLKEGFDLQKHLLSLRRYYFLEVADWADMFILSLWQQKKVFLNVDQRVSDLQGLLELSIQRSSCEWDLNWTRLFIFSKGHNSIPKSTATGIQSLDILGLGYRIDWPVSIILTPTALGIYDNIFNFLIKVKLVLLSLTSLWSLLKESKHFHSQNIKSKAHVQEVSKFAIIVKIRHRLNHFISMLQQYLQSQLSHVSWCKFLQALEHEVKDMMDLESAHMDYLLESLHICFLSDETRDIAGAIQNILECAIEFQDIVNRGVREANDEGDLLYHKLKINIAQVYAIKEMFEKNVKELHLIYLKSPKHGKFGLSHFWGYLNYNGFYWD